MVTKRTTSKASNASNAAETAEERNEHIITMRVGAIVLPKKQAALKFEIASTDENKLGTLSISRGGIRWSGKRRGTFPLGWPRLAGILNALHKEKLERAAKREKTAAKKLKAKRTAGKAK